MRRRRVVPYASATTVVDSTARDWFMVQLRSRLMRRSLNHGFQHRHYKTASGSVP